MGIKIKEIFNKKRVLLLGLGFVVCTIVVLLAYSILVRFEGGTPNQNELVALPYKDEIISKNTITPNDKIETTGAVTTKPEIYTNTKWHYEIKDLSTLEMKSWGSDNDDLKQSDCLLLIYKSLTVAIIAPGKHGECIPLDKIDKDNIFKSRRRTGLYGYLDETVYWKDVEDLKPTFEYVEINFPYSFVVAYWNNEALTSSKDNYEEYERERNIVNNILENINFWPRSEDGNYYVEGEDCYGKTFKLNTTDACNLMKNSGDLISVVRDCDILHEGKNFPVCHYSSVGFGNRIDNMYYLVDRGGDAGDTWFNLFEFDPTDGEVRLVDSYYFSSEHPGNTKDSDYCSQFVRFEAYLIRDCVVDDEPFKVDWENYDKNYQENSEFVKAYKKYVVGSQSEF